METVRPMEKPNYLVMLTEKQRYLAKLKDSDSHLEKQKQMVMLKVIGWLMGLLKVKLKQMD